MKIGVPSETKDGEGRVALVPAGAAGLVAAGHEVAVQAGAGIRGGFADADYAAAGARLVTSAAAAFDADLVVKVKEIQPEEWPHLRPDSILFCYLHLLADVRMTEALLQRRISGIAFETVEDRSHRLALLAPMSIIAGELAAPVAAHLLMAPQGGRGVMMRDARVLVLGAGSAGCAAASAARAMGASVTLLSRPGTRLDEAIQQLAGLVEVRAASPQVIADAVRGADVVVGAVNVPGAPTPRLLSRDAVRSMGSGAVLIDVCIDGGGVADSSRPTQHSSPTYVEEGITHYAVANMPAAVPRSASLALSAAALPYLEALTTKGLAQALRDDAGLACGLQMHGGRLTHAGVAAALGKPLCDLDALLFAC